MCLFLSPILTEQSVFNPILIQRRLALYRSEMLLTESNYLVRKVGTNFLQSYHRKKTTVVQGPIGDFYDKNSEKNQTDLILSQQRKNQEWFDQGVPPLLDDENQLAPTTSTKNSDSPFRVPMTLGTICNQ